MKERKSWTKPQSVMELLLLTLMIVQLLYVIWSNLTQMSYHLGYDASSNYLKAMEMYRQGAIFPAGWMDTTTPFLDMPTPLAALLMVLCRNVFTAYGLANVVCVIAAIALMLAIQKKLGHGRVGTLLLINLFLCPYVDASYTNMNPLEYYSCVLSSAAYYVGRIILALLFFYIWLCVCRGEKFGLVHKLLLAVALLGFFVSAVSSGTYMTATILVPAILYGIAVAAKKNDVKEFLAPCQRVTYAFLLASAAGMVMQRLVLHLQARDAAMSLILLPKFWANFGSIITGMLSLLSALPNEQRTPVFSLEGIACLCGMAIALALLVGLILGVKKQFSGAAEWNGTQLLPMIVLSNVLMFSLLATSYVGTVFETRYLIIPAIFLFMCFTLWIEELDRESLLFKMGCVLLLVCLAVKDVDGDLILHEKKVDTGQMDEVAQMAAEYPDAEIVYFFGEDDCVLERNMRVWDTSHYYRLLSDMDLKWSYYLTWGDAEDTECYVKLWGDYIYGITREEYDGATLLIADESEFDSLPPELQGCYEKVSTLREWNVYKSQTNELVLQDKAGDELTKALQAMGYRL